MRRIATLITLSSLLFAQFFPFAVLAQKKNIDVKDFDVTFPEEVIINEAFDMTVKAVDAGGKKITDYEGTVYFDNVNRPPADVVLPSFGDEGYTFQLSDQWEHTFSKAFTFKKPGVYEIDVYEIETTGDGITKTVKITAVEKNAPPATKAEVTITEPVNNITVSTKSITVSGTSKENSTINILLNDKKVATTQTLKDGKFSKEIDGLVSGNNKIKAEVLDGDGVVVGTSTETTIKYSTETPKITSLTIKEGTEFLAGESITFMAVWDANLKTVQVKVGDKNTLLQEDKNNLGNYSGVFKTSEFEGEFTATVAVESQLGVKATPDVKTKFSTVSAKIENVKIETTKDKKVRFTFDLVPDLDQIKYFEIKYWTESKKYTKSVTTYEKAKIQEEWKYTWYIPNIQPGEYFSTIIGLDANKKATSITSGEQEFTVQLDAAPTCFVEKISGFKIDQTTSTYSVLSWDAQKDAASYQIFKRNGGGDFSMIDEVTTNKYRINVDMSAGQKVFEDFKVRGVCKNEGFVWEWAFSESVKVQTGPELIIFFALFIASGIAFILARRGYIH